MKKILLALMTLIAMLGFMGCPPADNPGDPVVEMSKWWIKGSFDDWQDGGGSLTVPATAADRHYFVIDELDNNILTFEIGDLYAIDYEFVLVDADGAEVKYSTDDNVAADAAFAMGGDKNVSFTAAKKSYTVQLDITDPDAPLVTLVSGTEAAKVVDFAALASRLTIKGDEFSIGWTATAGVADAVAETVTFEVTAGNKNGSFGFNSLDNFLKCDAIASPTVEGTSAAEVELTTTASSNATITDMPMADSVYTIVVAIDDALAVNAGKYMMTVTLKTEGVTNWAFDVPPIIWPTGTLTGGWTAVDGAPNRPPLTLVAGVITYSYTHAGADGMVNFKYATAANSGWDNLVGFSGVDTTGTTVAIYDDSGNIAFDAVDGTTYTVTFDFSGTYTTTGIPSVTID